MCAITIRQAVQQAIDEEMQRNAAVIILGAESGAWPEEYIDRIVNLPAGNSMLASGALGLAMTGARPVVFIPGEDLLRSADVIANEIALTESMYASQYDSGVVIVAPVGFAPHNGPQISQSWESIFTQFPGLNVVYPSNAADAKALMKAALAMNTPTLFLENKSIIDEEDGEDGENAPSQPLPFGTASVRREGKDVTIVTYGPMVSVCEKAAQLASESGLFSEVIDLRALKPLDIETVCASLKKTNKLIIVHESRRSGGIGAEICAQIAESEALYYLDSRIIRVCCADEPVPYARREFEKLVPNEEDVLRAIILLSTGE